MERLTKVGRGDQNKGDKEKQNDGEEEVVYEFNCKVCYAIYIGKTIHDGKEDEIT